MPDRGTLEILAEEFAAALEPLTSAFAVPGGARDLLETLGWDFAAAPAAVEALQTSAGQAASLVREEVPAGQLPNLLNRVRAAFAAIADLGGNAGLPADFRADFPRQLVDFLLVEWLLRRQPAVGQPMLAAGIIRLEPRPAAGTRPDYVRRIFAFEDFGPFFQDPLVFFRNAYRFGQSDFRGESLLQNFGGLFDSWGLRTRPHALDAPTLAQLAADAIDPASASPATLRLVLVEQSVRPAEFGAGVGLYLLPETAADRPGFALLPYARGEFDQPIPIGRSLTLAFRGSLNLDGGLGVLVRPNRDVRFFAGFGAGSPAAVSGNLAAALTLARTGGPIVVVGRANASRLEFTRLGVEAGTRFQGGGRFEVFTEFALDGGRIVVKPDPGERDGFLARLLPGDGLSIDLDLTVGLSTTQGLYFGGSGGLEIALPAHVRLGPIEIVSALLAVRFRDGKLPVELAATIAGDFGVLKATVENIGLTAEFTFPPDRKGNLGPVDLALKFRPPNGVGLAIDAGVVKGGGYLFLDFEKGEYAGALELTFSGFLSLKAIGLINTRLPGNQPGFSLLVIITAEFVPGLQLGYGFTLTGVGGLLGLNRTMLLEPLALAVRTGAANNILFPRDVIANAPQILSDLRAIFPPQEGRFLIGPMAKLGWGTPTLVSLSLGIIIEIPGNVVILGRLRVNLPTEDSPLILLQVTFVGAIEFDKRRVWFFASLFDSRVLFITIDGEMGLLMDFSDNPDFVLSVGGFHPRFSPPALPFPSPRRIAISIVNESFARIRAEGYFAVTSNSVQFGARAEMFFGFSALSVEGFFVFDALFRFSPLSFEVEMASGFAVKVFGLGVWGVTLRGLLSGPRPWRVRGSASISLLFFDISVDVDVTFGDPGGETIPAIAVMPLIGAEFRKPQNWVAALPPSASLLVSLRKIDAEGELVLHPLGALRVSQRLVPLGLPIDRVGNQKAADVNQLGLRLAAAGLSAIGPRKEPFARAHFQPMSDSDKLSKPAFEPMDSGTEMAAGAAGWAAGAGAERMVRYEAIIVDTLFERFRLRFFRFWGALFVHFQAGSAIARSPMSLATERQGQPFAEKITVAGERYALANVRDNSSAAVATFESHAEAEAHMNRTIASDPRLGETIHVIPAMDLRLAA
jgi:hypothetical protein